VRRIIIRVVEILHRDFEYSEFQGACLAIVWGIWLMLPGGSFNPSIVKLVMRNVQDLRLLGVLSILLGVVQMVTLLRNNLSHRRTAAFWAVLFWVYNFAIIAVQNWRLMPTPMLFLYSLGAAWAYWRLGRLLRSNAK